MTSTTTQPTPYELCGHIASVQALIESTRGLNTEYSLSSAPRTTSGHLAQILTQLNSQLVSAARRELPIKIGDHVNISRNFGNTVQVLEAVGRKWIRTNHHAYSIETGRSSTGMSMPYIDPDDLFRIRRDLMSAARRSK